MTHIRRTRNHACAATTHPDRWLLTWLDRYGEPDLRNADTRSARDWCNKHGIPFAGGVTKIQTAEHLKKKLASVL